MSATIEIDLDRLAAGRPDDVLRFAVEMITAITEAYAEGLVTYVVSNRQVIAAVNPPEAAERYEHANEVLVAPRQHEETVPVIVRAERLRRRRPWFTRGPFEGIF